VNIKPFINTLIIASLITVLAGQRHSAIVLVMVVPIVIGWIIITGFLTRRQAQLQSVFLSKVFIWVIAFSVVGGLHVYYANAARTVANDFVAALERYRMDTGSYPAAAGNLGQIEVSRLQAWKVIYDFNAERPVLVYAATGTFRATYRFDFETKVWIYNAD